MPRKIIAVDTETTGLYTWKGHRPFLVSTCDEKLHTAVYDLRDDPMPEKLVRMLANPKVDCVFHNIRFDIRMLEAAGFKIAGELHDTMAAYRLAYQLQYSIALDVLAEQFLGMHCKEDKGMDDARKKIARESEPKRLMEQVLFSEVPREIIYPYAMADVKRTMMLWQQVFPALEEHWALYRNEVDLWRVTAAMEERGVLVDANRAMREYGKERAQQHQCAGRVKKLLSTPGLNLNSPKQIAIALSKVVDMIYFKASGAQKTSDDALQRYKHPAAKLILDFRKHDKLAGTYYGPITEKLHEGILHPSFMAQGARTGRFSSRKPNFQNLPKGVRSIILPRPGYVFLSADYRQIELRLIAHYAKCAKLLEAFKAGRDPHTENCQLLFGDTEEAHRKVAKNCNFAFCYGVGVRRLQDMVFPIIGELSTEDAQGFLTQLRTTYPEIARFKQGLEHGIKENGFMETAFGRVFPECRDTLKDCVNYMIQGSAADVLKHAMVQLLEPLSRAGAYIVATVHDELVVETPVKKEKQVIALLHEHMTSTGTPSGVKWLVPLPIEIKRSTTNWAEQEKLDGSKWKHLAEIEDEPEVTWTDSPPVPLRRIVLPGKGV